MALSSEPGKKCHRSLKDGAIYRSGTSVNPLRTEITTLYDGDKGILTLHKSQNGLFLLAKNGVAVC
ncbi:hypothetical protein [Dickeya dianthicola]|uniref:hypothetical protein n=1 Tax=Dickeya dianthicola TaxID=204039 RepID=UPI00301A503D